MQRDTGFAFAASGLDRAAEMRGNPEALAALKADPQSRAIILWQSKPLIDQTEDGPRLVRLPLDHALVQSASDWILLGRCSDTAAPVFACDISSWEPEGQSGIAGTAFLDPSEQRHPDAPETARFLEIRGFLAQLTLEDGELAATARALLNWHGAHGFCAKCGAPTHMSQAGWQRDCPSCNAHHFPRTDPVVIMLITSGNRTLLGRSHGWPDGMYSCLAGFIEPGETMEAAVRREVLEEAGIPVGAVRYVASQPWPYPSSLMFGCTGLALSEDITLDPHELDDALWISREDLTDAFAGTHATIKPARKGSIAHYLLKNWLGGRLD